MKRDSTQILTEWLVLKAQSGDSQAMNLLAKQWYPILLRYAAYQIQDDESAKDVVQETLIAVSKGIRKLNDPAAFSRWIYQILHRRGVDYVRNRIKERSNDNSYIEFDNKVFDEDRMASSIDIQRALRNLKDNSYQLVHLHYLHGFNSREIATITGIPEGTIKSRLHAARNHLRQLLGGISHE